MPFPIMARRFNIHAVLQKDTLSLGGAAERHWARSLLLAALALLLLAFAGHAQAAAAYTFPGSLPSGCSGTGTNYTCTGNLSLGWQDSISIVNPGTTINVAGNLSTNSNEINKTSPKSDFTLQVGGTVSGGNGIVMTGRLEAGGNVSLANDTFITGNVQSTGGTFTLGSSATITGSVEARSDIFLGSSSTVSGTVQSTNGKVTLGSSVTVAGKITGREDVVLGSSARAQAGVESTNGAVTLGPSVKVTGSAKGNGNVYLGSSSVVTAGVESTNGKVTTDSSAQITGGVVAKEDISLGSSSIVSGAVESSNGAVTLQAASVKVTGDIRAKNDITLGSSSRVIGNIESAIGGINVKSASAHVTGNLTAKNDITLGSSTLVEGDVESDNEDVVLQSSSVRVTGCVRAKAHRTINLGSSASVGGVCCSHGNNCSKESSCVTAASGVTYGLCSAPPPTAPSGFNAVDGSCPVTDADAKDGKIKTKVAGRQFSLPIVALDGSQKVDNSFKGKVKVELVDFSDGQCASAQAIGSSGTIDFAASDSGCKAVQFTENNAWKKVAVRMSYPDSGTPTVTACSGDRFAIRPDKFHGVLIQHTDWENPGTTETLNNTTWNNRTTTPTGAVHKAGRSFTLAARAVNALGVVTGGYAGTADLILSNCVTASPACVEPSAAALTTSDAPSSQLSNVIFRSGELIKNDVIYKEVGAFALEFRDKTFADVDIGDGTLDDCAEGGRYICHVAVDVGRFVPDHLVLVEAKSAVTPVCPSVDFSYMGQGFNVSFAVEARNHAGVKTRNHSRNPATLNLDFVAENNSNGVDLSSRLTKLPPLTPPSGSWSSGEYKLNIPSLPTTPATPNMAFNRSTSRDGPFDSLEIGVKVSDQDGVELQGYDMRPDTTGDCVAASNCTHKKIGSTKTKIRYGRARMLNANGSELLPLSVPLALEYWNATGWAQNTDDTCTNFSSENFAFNYPVDSANHLLACETSISNITSGTNPRYLVNLRAPGPGNNGWADITLNLGATGAGNQCVSVGGTGPASTSANMPWLQFDWGNGESNPRARATFGVMKSNGPILFRREIIVR